MSIRCYERKDLGGRVEVAVCRKGQRRRRLAPEGMGKRQAAVVVGEALLAEMEAEEKAASEATRPPTLWSFCKDVYAEKHGVAPGTWRKRKYKVAGIMEDLGDLRLTEVTTPVVTAWVERLRAEGAPVKAGGRGKLLGEDALNDYIVVLRAIFRVAVEQGYLDKVPFTTKSMPLDLATDREPWTEEMKQRLLATAEKRDPGIHRLAKGLMLTGYRPEEALRLHWTDVADIPSPRLRIMGKGLRRRVLPLKGKLGEFFRELPRNGEAVFPVENGSTAGSRFKFWPKRRWDRAVGRLESRRWPTTSATPSSRRW